MTICPRDCPNRSATCHAECETYILKKQEYEEAKAALNKGHKADCYLAERSYRKKDRFRKRRNSTKMGDFR